MRLHGVIVAVALVAGPLCAGDLAAPTLAKFIRVVVQATNSKAVACGDRELAAELAGMGVTVDPEARLVWADTVGEVKAHVRLGKLVICGSRHLLASGAAIAVAAEGGHPVIYVNAKALAASGTTLPDNFLKIAKVS